MKEETVELKKGTTLLRKHAKKLRDLKEEKDKLEQKLTETNISIQKENEEFVKVMELENVTAFKTPGIGTCFLAESVYPRITDEVLLFKDLRKKRLGKLIKEKIHSSTLRGLVNECLAEGKELPKGIECFYKTEVRIRRG